MYSLHSRVSSLVMSAGVTYASTRHSGQKLVPPEAKEAVR
jgi:hypothetical protein